MDKTKPELVELLIPKLDFQIAYTCVQSVELKYGLRPISMWIAKIQLDPKQVDTFISKCIMAGWLNEDLTLNPSSLPNLQSPVNNADDETKQPTTIPVPATQSKEAKFFDEVSFYSGQKNELIALTLSHSEKNKSGKPCLFLSFAKQATTSKSTHSPEFDWNNALRYQLYPTEALALLNVVLGVKEQLFSPSLKPDSEPGIYHEFDSVSKRLKARYQSNHNTVYIECIQGNNKAGVNLYPEGRLRFTAYIIGKIKLMHPYNNLDDATILQLIKAIL